MEKTPSQWNGVLVSKRRSSVSKKGKNTSQTGKQFRKYFYCFCLAEALLAEAEVEKTPNNLKVRSVYPTLSSCCSLQVLATSFQFEINWENLFLALMFYTKTFVMLSGKTFDKNNAWTSVSNQSGLLFLWTHTGLNAYKNFEKIQKRIVPARKINIFESMKQKLGRAEYECECFISVRSLYPQLTQRNEAKYLYFFQSLIGGRVQIEYAACCKQISIPWLHFQLSQAVTQMKKE